MESLIGAVRDLSVLAGVPQDPGPAIRRARPGPDTTGSLANEALALLACARATTGALSGLTAERLAAVASGTGTLNAARFAGVRACAPQLWQATADLERALVTEGRAGPIDVWPVLRLETGTAANFYAHDYMLQVDEGGDDSYMNNAGANMIDVLHGPPGSPAPQQTPFAPGCRNALGGLANVECVPLAGVLLDLSGNDRYGVEQDPDPTLDGRCTAEPLVRRQSTAGTGFAGVGILRDVAGDDSYTGKTVAVGAGHVFGIGIVSDAAGNDTYRVVRNGIGFGLFGGLGLVRDEVGADRYEYHIPAPLDPSAPNETPGAGGVIDDTGSCDNRPRFTAGAGNLGAVGMLVDLQGDDAYLGAYSDDYAAPAGTGRGGSLGFASNGGVGVLYDEAGADGYTIVGSQGLPPRADGVVIPPGQQSTGSGGLFVDR
jgi:hypothetical protein